MKNPQKGSMKTIILIIIVLLISSLVYYKIKFNPNNLLPASPETLQSKKWLWQKTIMKDGSVVVPMKAGKFTITFKGEGNVDINTDCNEFGAAYQMGNDGSIKLNNMIGT